MARLRLFANLRESAGTSRAEFPGDTVGDVVDAASESYGNGFAAGLATAKVWVNGNPAERSTAVTDGDEIALIPPVSGGALVTQGQNDLLGLLLPAALGMTLLVANNIGGRAFAFALVGATLAWLWDVADVLEGQRRLVNLIPAMVGVTVTVNTAYAWGREGLVAGLVVATVVTLTWTTLDARQRSIEAVATSVTMAAVASLGAGLLMIVRLNDTIQVVGFVVVATAGVLFAGLMSGSGPQMAGMDPNLAMVIGAVVGGLIAPGFSDTATWSVFGLSAALAGAGLVAGRALGSIVRNGRPIHTRRAPGTLTAVDAVPLGAVGWWIGLLLFG